MKQSRKICHKYNAENYMTEITIYHLTWECIQDKSRLQNWSKLVQRGV